MMKDTWGLPSLILGTILFVLGAVPLLASLGVLPFALPGFIGSMYTTIAAYAFAACGLFIVIEDITAMGEMLTKWIPLGIGLLLLVVGAVDILASFNVIGFSFDFLPQIVYQALFVLEGIALWLSAFE